MNSYRFQALREAIKQCGIDPVLICRDYEKMRRYGAELSTQYVLNLKATPTALQKHKAIDKYWIE